MKTQPGHKLERYETVFAFIRSPKIYIDFFKSGKLALMPTAIIQRWACRKQLQHDYYAVIEIVQESDLIAKVLKKYKTLGVM